MRPSTPSLALVLICALAACSPDVPTSSRADAPDLTRLDGSETGGLPLVASMLGLNEVPAGDPDGGGSVRFTLNHGQGTVCYETTVWGIDLPATASHIHVGGAGVGAGRPVVMLAAPDASGSASGCVAVDRDVIAAIIADPSGYYVNVHNASYPPGAVRGQLQRP